MCLLVYKQIKSLLFVYFALFYLSYKTATKDDWYNIVNVKSYQIVSIHVLIITFLEYVKKYLFCYY